MWTGCYVYMQWTLFVFTLYIIQHQITVDENGRTHFNWISSVLNSANIKQIITLICRKMLFFLEIYICFTSTNYWFPNEWWYENLFFISDSVHNRKNEHSVGLLLLLSLNIQVDAQLLRDVLSIYFMSTLSSC